jgi:uncharacterized protein YecE (DUF72 family)
VAEVAPAPIRVGTAGWAYEDWNAIVYPQRPPRGFDRLALMASLFDTNEINSTFYRIPPPRMTADWARRVGHNRRFRFTAKLFRGFTHDGNAGSAEEKAFAEAMELLAREGRLGCVLAQFPYSFHNTAENRERLKRVLAAISRFPAAAEFRHASWNSKEARDLLAARAVAFVNIDQPALDGNLPGTAHVTAPIAYFRFHGRNAPKWFGPDTSNEERYNYLYTPEELEPWVDRIRDGADRAASLSDESTNARVEAGVYAILNNHFRGQAVANALELNSLLNGARPMAPADLVRAYPRLAAFTRAAEAARGAESSAQRSLFADADRRRS